MGTASSLEILDSQGSSNCLGLGISPDGQQIVGAIDQKGIIWSGKKTRRLSFGTNYLLLNLITDSGFAGGVSSIGGVIYDSHGAKVELFDQWWARKYPTVPLPAHVSRVFDLYEFGGNLYCLIGLNDVTTNFRTTALAIAPLKNKGNLRRSQK